MREHPTPASLLLFCSALLPSFDRWARGIATSPPLSHLPLLSRGRDYNTVESYTKQDPPPPTLPPLSRHQTTASSPPQHASIRAQPRWSEGAGLLIPPNTPPRRQISIPHALPRPSHPLTTTHSLSPALHGLEPGADCEIAAARATKSQSELMEGGGSGCVGGFRNC
ncbi:uncharacterized protein BDZ99DRAFT_144589 [Mytilinidion resinicola]|uniref:Uncharacterized protein n=1 Tax=Mytilinidion resinicola TaxID=574789 RepID=A0A6A6YAK8_9PEZI|nr:uncharacterized protein BDZ99DRAFT_144589 [Mytilinidion resinicola]KAF2804867.1 hypothetical protein BDZ99DRAFT_144589 [Mytilinidion resinicola]